MDFKCSLFILWHIPLIYWRPHFLLACCQDYRRKGCRGNNYCISWKISSCAYIQNQHCHMRLFSSRRLFLNSLTPLSPEKVISPGLFGPQKWFTYQNVGNFICYRYMRLLETLRYIFQVKTTSIALQLVISLRTASWLLVVISQLTEYEPQKSPAEIWDNLSKEKSQEKLTFPLHFLPSSLVTQTEVECTGSVPAV